MISIHNFTNEIPYIILKRGKNYYSSGAIIELTVNDGIVTSTVSGTYDYKVSMNIGENGSLTGIHCTCPYAGEAYCKHEAAVMFALREYINDTYYTKPNTDLKQLLLNQ